MMWQPSPPRTDAHPSQKKRALPTTGHFPLSLSYPHGLSLSLLSSSLSLILFLERHQSLRAGLLVDGEVVAVPKGYFAVYVGAEAWWFVVLMSYLHQSAFRALMEKPVPPVPLLRFSTGGLPTGTFGLSGISTWEALLLEIVMTFGLVYTVYATAVDPKKGSLGTIAPIAIGFIVGANILVGGAFSGASMNPAVSFGPALVSWEWGYQWVYWVGPLIGGGLAGVIYELLFISRTHEQLPTTDY